MGTILTCELCGCPIQRTTDGDLTDGLDAHLRMVHTVEEWLAHTGVEAQP